MAGHGISRGGGFTIRVIVLLVLALGIAAAVAVPGYRSYALRMNRADAQRDLVGFAQRLQRCFMRTGDYTAADCRIDFSDGIANAEGTYATSAVVGHDTYTLTATPIGSQVDDSDCGRFTLDQAGAQGVSGGTLPAEQCWLPPDG